MQAGDGDTIGLERSANRGRNRSVRYDQMQRVAEDGDVANAVKMAHAFDGVADPLAFEQQQRTLDRAQLELGRRSQRDQFAAIHQRQTVAVFGFVHVVRGDEDSDAVGAHPLNQFPEQAARERVDA